MTAEPDAVAKLETGLPGLDDVTLGGLPRGRSTLVSGTSGTGKTVFAVQFLAAGIDEYGQNGVFVTCEETPGEIRRNAAGFGFDLTRWEEQGRWAFVDASPDSDDISHEAGRYDLDGLLARVEYAITRAGADRVAIDSLGSLVMRFKDAATIRAQLYRIFSHLKSLGVTVVVTAERSGEDGSVARFGVEEYVADNVIVLRNNAEYRTRRRTVEVLKFRGTDHLKGEWPFAILAGGGFQVVPHNARTPQAPTSAERVTIGQSELDVMLGGGVFRGSMVLVSGAPGTGKTLLVNHFASGAAQAGERCLLVAFEEGHDQLVRNASHWGIDFRSLESNDRLRIHCGHPDAVGTEEQLIRISNLVDEFHPDRVVVDGLSAIASSGGEQASYDFVMGLTTLVKQRGLICLLTSSTTSLLGGGSITESRASTLADVIILLRYVEICGAVARSIAALKARGSAHDRDLREFKIDGRGMHIGEVFSNVTGILSGRLTVITDDELARTHGVLEEMPESHSG